MKSKYFLLFIALLACSLDCIAQPRLEVRLAKIDSDYTQLYLTTFCKDSLRVDLHSRNFKIVDNAVEINDAEVKCPDASRHVCVSAALVLDCSRNNPSLLPALKNCAFAFIDAMDGQCDEATLLSFSNTVRDEVFMTNDKIALTEAIQRLSESDGSSLFEAAYKGITELVNNGTQESRAILIFTAGRDAGSCRDIINVIRLAVANRIRIYIIGAGVDLNDPSLKQLAEETGGKFIGADFPSHVVQLYKEITTILGGGFYECVVEYRTRGLPTDPRTISITLQSLFGCPGADTQKIDLNLPPDSLALILDTSQGRGIGKSNNVVSIPLKLYSSANKIKPRFYFDLKYDRSLLQFVGFKKAGYLLTDYDVASNLLSDGVRLSVKPTLGSPAVNGRGTLGEFIFTVVNLKSDTACLLRLSDGVFDSIAVKPRLDSAWVQLFAYHSRAACSSVQAPTEIVWDANKGQYSPSPFWVEFSASNCGEARATSATATISFDTTRLALVSPLTRTQRCNPDYIDPSGTASVSWQLAPKPASRTDTVRIQCTIAFDNNPSITCETQVIIRAAGTTGIDEANSDPRSLTLSQNYPNPFTDRTTIDFQITDFGLQANKIRNPQSVISFKVYDVFGREVLDLSGRAIEYSPLIILHSQLPGPGVYFYKLTIGTQSQTKMMVLLRN